MIKLTYDAFIGLAYWYFVLGDYDPVVFDRIDIIQCNQEGLINSYKLFIW